MSWVSALASVGKGVVSLFPGGSLAVTALEGIGKIADAVGGNEGEKISKGIQLISEGMKQIGQKPLTPEQQANMAEEKNRHEEEILKVALKRQAFVYQDQAGGRDIVKTALMSDDPLVRQARPKMMILMGKSCIAYVFFAPLIIWLASDLAESPLSMIVDMLTWCAGFLTSTFIASFTGYTVARTVDKKTANGAPVGKLLSTLALAGKKIS